MNRATLLIPLICGKLDEHKILFALENTKHKELKEWEEENIPYTVRRKRFDFFNNYIQKLEMDKSA